MHGCVGHKCSVQGPYSEFHILSCFDNTRTQSWTLSMYVCALHRVKFEHQYVQNNDVHNAFYAHRNDIEHKHKSHHVN